jgi:Apea-like HEPN
VGLLAFERSQYLRRFSENRISRMAEVKNLELFELARICVREANEHVQRYKQERRYIPGVSNYPSFGTFESGWPNVSHSLLASGVPKYSGIFAAQRSDTALGYEDIPHLEELFAFAAQHDRLRAYFTLGEDPASDDHDRIFRIMVSWVVFEVLDRVLHLYSDEFSDEQLREVYAEYEMGLLEAELPIEVVVPVALTPFETTKRIELRPGILLERMSEGWQLARVPDEMYGRLATASPVVVEAATHSIVLTGYTMPNETRVGARTDTFRFYPLDVIERVFTAIRIVTGLDTGFGQIAIRPIGWADRWVGALPAAIKGALGRRYPPWFDDWGWLRKPPPPITQDQVTEIATVDDQLENAPAQVTLAARRLSAAMLREHEEDAIVDLCIGLEAALGEAASRTEMTHKLSLRAAAVLAASSPIDPREAFSHVKGIYAYRSAVVHGTNAEKKRHLKSAAGDEVFAVDVAQRFLRLILRALLQHPEWQSARRIDELLVVSALQSWQT